jgi:drug/metabolite transporter (DMT)-like permease
MEVSVNRYVFARQKPGQEVHDGPQAGVLRPGLLRQLGLLLRRARRGGPPRRRKAFGSFAHGAGVDRGRAILLTLSAAVLWGTSFPANDLGLQATDPFTFMAVRFTLAFAASAAAALAWGGLDPRWLRDRRVWAVAGTSALGYQLQFIGQQLTPPGSAALMVNVGNLAVPLLAFLLLGERLGGAKLPATMLAAAGVVLVGSGGDLARLGGAPLLGLALTLAAGIAWAAVIVLNKVAVEGPRPLELTTWVIGLTALLSLPGVLLLGSHQLPMQALAAAAYTGLACTTLAFVLWSVGLRAMSSVVSGLLLFLEIVVALALSVALGLEALGPWKLAGAACILGAILLISVAPPAAPERRASDETSQS